MDLSARTIARMTAPSVFAFSWLLLGMSLVLSSTGEAPLSFVRFSAALAAGVSFAVSARLWDLSRRRGDTWDGALVSLPLPYFDSELHKPAVRSTSALAPVPVLGAVVALGVLFAAAQPSEVGHFVVTEGSSAYAWSDAARGGVGRELPGQLDVTRLDADEGVLELRASRVGTDWSSTATLAPGVGVEIGEISATWSGVVPSESVASVSLDVRDGDDARTVNVAIGETIELGAGEVRVLEFDENRQGALGPAVLVVVDGTEVWLHLWGAEAHHRYGEGPTLALAGLEEGTGALLEVRAVGAEWPILILLIAAGLIVAVLGRAASRPVFVRGRSGDYELVGPTRRSVERAARRLLRDEEFRAWSDLLVRLRRTGRAG